MGLIKLGLVPNLTYTPFRTGRTLAPCQPGADSKNKCPVHTPGSRARKRPERGHSQNRSGPSLKQISLPDSFLKRKTNIPAPFCRYRRWQNSRMK